MSSLKTALGLTFFAALSACQGNCSCGSSNDDDGGSGGSGAATSTPTSSASGVTSSASGGDGGAASTGAGGNGQGAATGSGGQGGSGQGGAGQGGAGQGGGERVAERECRVAEDCQLVDDCCTCDAIPAGDTPEECVGKCEQSSCTAQERGNEARVACVAGRCAAGFECDWNLTLCDAAPPNCPDGQTASVIGTCYGPCVLATECLSVASCDQCDGGLACVQQSAFTVSTHCVTDEPCLTDDCECLGPSVCNEEDACTDDGEVVVCECTNC